MLSYQWDDNLKSGECTERKILLKTLLNTHTKDKYPYLPHYLAENSNRAHTY